MYVPNIPQYQHGPCYKDQNYPYLASIENEVLMDEWRITNDELFTDSVVTCVALAAINRETGLGLLGHFDGITVPEGKIQNDHNIFNRAVSVIPYLGPPKSTYVRLAGAAIYFKYGDPSLSVQEERMYAEEEVRIVATVFGIPSKQIKAGWLWGNEHAKVAINCQKHTIIVEEEMIR